MNSTQSDIHPRMHAGELAVVGSSGGSRVCQHGERDSRAKRWGGPLALRLTTLPLFGESGCCRELAGGSDFFLVLSQCTGNQWKSVDAWLGGPTEEWKCNMNPVSFSSFRLAVGATRGILPASVFGCTIPPGFDSDCTRLLHWMPYIYACGVLSLCSMRQELTSGRLCSLLRRSPNSRIAAGRHVAMARAS